MARVAARDGLLRLRFPAVGSDGTVRYRTLLIMRKMFLFRIDVSRIRREREIDKGFIDFVFINYIRLPSENFRQINLEDFIKLGSVENFEM